jgi:O-acetyl-ADP-ribose deacetylase (regulator of RNase III)
VIRAPGLIVQPSFPETKFHDGRVVVLTGDLTVQSVDAVVNAANSSLMGGGGVDGAIHKVGGARILEECRDIRSTLYPEGLPTGGAVITSGGNLQARHVIHTVGPIYGQQSERAAELLAACYRNSLSLAVLHNISTIAFPSISTGAYGYPRAEAAAVSSLAISEFLASTDQVSEVRLVFHNANDTAAFLKSHCFV